MDAEQCVDELIVADREGMVERAEWIHEHRPQFSAGMAIFGGEEASILFEDSQLCYIHGTFAGSIILGQSFIEQSISALAYGAGEFEKNDRPGYHEARNFLEENDLIEPEDIEGVPLDELHNLRNPLVHFRQPTDEGTILNRKMESVRQEPETEAPTTHEMLQGDAERVLKTCFSVCRIFGVGDHVE